MPLLAGSDQNVAGHDFRHAFDELEDILPHPTGRNFIGGERLIRAVEHADADEHFRSAFEQVIRPEAWELLQPRHETSPHAPTNLLCRTACEPEFPDDGEHVPSPDSAAGACSGRR